MANNLNLPRIEKELALMLKATKDGFLELREKPGADVGEVSRDVLAFKLGVKPRELYEFIWSKSGGETTQLFYLFDGPYSALLSADSPTPSEFLLALENYVNHRDPRWLEVIKTIRGKAIYEKLRKEHNTIVYGAQHRARMGV